MPWSVPPLPFSPSRRPNSEKTSTTHPLRLAGLLQVVEERLERRAQLAQQARVLLELAAVGVEAVEVGVVDRRRQAGLDELGDQAEPPGQAVEVGVIRPWRPSRPAAPARAVRCWHT